MDGNLGQTGSIAALPRRSLVGRLFRVGLVLMLIIITAAGGGVAAIWVRSERRVKSTARELTVHATPELVARGKYLASVSCQLCHSRDFAGGRDFPLPIVLSFAANITQDKETGIGAWTDGQIEEAIRRGVATEHPGAGGDPHAKTGRILRPPMPVFNKLSDDDVQALIAFLRTVPAVSKLSRLPELTPLGRFIFGVVAKKPQHAVPSGIAPPSAAETGDYFANEVCRCSDCHHARDPHNQPVPGKLWGGGFLLAETGLPPVLTANISPDPVEGIGKWTKEQFVHAVRDGMAPSGRQLHEAMPRYPLAPEDGGAIFDYLKKQEPVRSHVWSGDALRGSELFARAGCASCHGWDGKGPRADITKAGASNDVAKLKAWIKDPASVKPGTQMPRLGIDDDKDLDALAKFVIELSKTNQTP